jgi:hypothetical protein
MMHEHKARIRDLSDTWTWHPTEAQIKKIMESGEYGEVFKKFALDKAMKEGTPKAKKYARTQK